MSPHSLTLAGFMLLAAAGCRGPHRDAPPAPTWAVRVEVDEGRGERAARAFDVRVPAGATALEATRAAVAVEQGWVCCSEDDVWAVDGLTSDPARDGWWSWWLDGELGPGFAHQVELHQGAIVTWRYSLADPEGRGAEPVARIAALEPAACQALEAFGAGRNLVAHGERCELEAHVGLARVAPDAPAEQFIALRLDALVDGPALADVPGIAFAPDGPAAAWEALGRLCGRSAAARAAYAARLAGR